MSFCLITTFAKSNNLLIKSISIYLCFIFSIEKGFSQEIKDSLIWSTKNKKEYAILSFNDCGLNYQYGHALPVYSHMLKLDQKASKINVKISNIKYQPLQESEKKLLGSFPISKNIEITSQVRTSRAKKYGIIKFIPLAVDPSTGKVSKLALS